MDNYYSGGGGGGGGSYPTSLAGSYWKGADGNVWVYGNDGTNNAGAWDNNTQSYWNNLGYIQIADPNALNATGVLGDSTYNKNTGSTNTSSNSQDLATFTTPSG